MSPRSSASISTASSGVAIPRFPPPPAPSRCSRAAGLRSGSCPTTRAWWSPTWWRSSPTLGVAADPAEVLTSAVAAGALLGSSLPTGAGVLPAPGPASSRRSPMSGLRSSATPAAAVVVGFHRDFDYDELDRASCAIRAGARFVATNLDADVPDAGRDDPGDRRARGRGRDRARPAGSRGQARAAHGRARPPAPRAPPA